MKREIVNYPFRVCTGLLETMNRIVETGGLKAFNTNTRRWQIIQPGAKYLVVKDDAPAMSSEYGEQWGATLFCSENLEEIQKEKGLDN